jgi:GAF domain-containing protein
VPLITALSPALANSSAAVGRTLYDIEQGFDAPGDAERHLQGALRLLRGLVPYDRCALLEVAGAGPARLVVEPNSPEEHAALRRVLTRFLTVLTDETKAGTDWQMPDISNLALWASPSHLAVPLIGFEKVLGVLFVRHRVANGYTNDHVRLLSIVASQIATYLTASRLREQHAEIVREQEAARAEADRSAAVVEREFGVSLTLARALVVLHGGRIEARSDGPGRGSEFVVRLPGGSPGE